MYWYLTTHCLSEFLSSVKWAFKFCFRLSMQKWHPKYFVSSDAPFEMNLLPFAPKNLECDADWKGKYLT